MAKKSANNDQDIPHPLGWLGRIGAKQNPPAWGMGDVLATSVVVLVAMFVLASGVGVAIAGDTSVVTPSDLLIGQGVGLLAIGGYVWAVRSRTPEEREGLRLIRGLLPLPYVLLLGVAAMLTLDLLAVATGAGFGRVAELRGLPITFENSLLAFVFMVILQPMGFGLAFCGVILPRLRASLGSWAGFWVTILAFTGVHYGLYGASLPQDQQLGYGVIVPLGLMFCLCAIRIRTSSTLATLLAYASAGLVSVVVMLALG